MRGTTGSFGETITRLSRIVRGDREPRPRLRYFREMRLRRKCRLSCWNSDRGGGGEERGRGPLNVPLINVAPSRPHLREDAGKVLTELTIFRITDRIQIRFNRFYRLLLRFCLFGTFCTHDPSLGPVDFITPE